MAKIKARVNLGVTAQTKQGHDSAWRNFNTYILWEVKNAWKQGKYKSQLSDFFVHICIMECHC